jgi:histidinol phosphatase-like PHP family hydrolase
MHSNWSDGSGSIRDMAEAALQRNYECISITDHSKGLKIAGGINEDQLKRQAEEISEINRSLKDSGKKLRVLRSIATLAGIKRERILNFMTRDELLNWVTSVLERTNTN